jgi:16S rRNA processing protein RimM
MQQAGSGHSPVPTDLIELGRIVSAYGVRGWVKIQPHAAGSQVLSQAPVWWLKAPQPLAGSGALPVAVAFPVQQARVHGATVVGQLQGVPNRSAAEGLKAYTVWVPRSQFPAPEADEYYWVDLIGCRLYGLENDQQVLIGVVASVSDNGAHAVLLVDRATEANNGELVPVLAASGKPATVLVPFVQAHVHTVDLPNRLLISNWPADF